MTCQFILQQNDAQTEYCQLRTIKIRCEKFVIIKRRMVVEKAKSCQQLARIYFLTLK
jgi:hypothetical protein